MAAVDKSYQGSILHSSSRSHSTGKSSHRKYYHEANKEFIHNISNRATQQYSHNDYQSHKDNCY